MSQVQNIAFGTKAETLERLLPRIETAKVAELLYFTAWQWENERVHWLRLVQTGFAPGLIAVRSSSLAEDREQQSNAGAFTSCLSIDSTSETSIETAVKDVLDSFDGNPLNQVLVQAMLQDVAVSGVITTHVLDDGAPYYVLNYDDESGKTDTVTGGTGVNKTVLVNRASSDSMIESDRVRCWLRLAKELESIFGAMPLEIEFAQTMSGELYLLQCRPLSPKNRWLNSVEASVTEAQSFIADFFRERSLPRPGLVGSRTILGEMPDWNPAEIIGTNPRPLATSLYRRLVTDEVWRIARARMGYRHPGHETLMVVLGGRPYIDVRNSFNSFLPASLSESVGEIVVNGWLDLLDSNPELHDKVEFEIAVTAMDFDFEETWLARYPNLLKTEELNQFRQCLTEMTLACLLGTGPGSLDHAIDLSKRLPSLPARKSEESAGQILARIDVLIAECIEYGTLPFAIAARHAFIAEAQLRSAARLGVFTSARLREFKASLVTVAGQMGIDLEQVRLKNTSRESFLGKYGHLRPGTYDILSLRYDQREELFRDIQPGGANLEKPHYFELTVDESAALVAALSKSGFSAVSPGEWLSYCRKAIVAREEIKFLFSRHLSEILERVVQFGSTLGLSRDVLSYVEIGQLLECRSNPIVSGPLAYFSEIARLGRSRMEVSRALRMSYLIRHERDLYVAPMHRSAPTFVSGVRIEASVIYLDARTTELPEVAGAIVCIENADPGFDWIFTRKIAGLVTQYGGSNSHMAVRSAELGLPAAIGCGQQTFQRLVAAGKIELNCADRIVRPLYS